MTPRIRLPDEHGFAFYLYVGDHPPPHVRTADKEAMIALGDENSKPFIMESKLKPSEDKKA